MAKSKAKTCAEPGCRSQTIYAKGKCRRHWYREWNREYMRRWRAKNAGQTAAKKN